jgi:hypothetical protein
MKNNRYISIKNEGHEIYIETVHDETTADLSKKVRRRLEMVRAAMPHGEWSATIEEELPSGNFSIHDVETNKDYIETNGSAS